MDRCPTCKRISLEWDPMRSEWRCLWYACRYVELRGEREKRLREDAGGGGMGECQDKRQMHSGVPGDDPWTECGRGPKADPLAMPCVGEDDCPYLRADEAQARVTALETAGEELATRVRITGRIGCQAPAERGACTQCPLPICSTRDVLIAWDKAKGAE